MKVTAFSLKGQDKGACHQGFWEELDGHFICSHYLEDVAEGMTSCVWDGKVSLQKEQNGSRP